MKKYLVALFCGLLLSSCAVPEKPQVTASSRKTDPAALHAVDAQRKAQAEAQKNLFVGNEKTIALITSVPDTMGGWFSDGFIMNYEMRAHGLGYSKKYHTPQNKEIYADIFSYHLMQKNLTDGIGSEFLKKAYQASVQEIQSTEGRIYKGIQAVEEKDVTVKGGEKSIPFKKYAFKALRVDGNVEVISTMFITVYKGAVLKIRITYPVAKVQNGSELVDGFMRALVKEIAG